MNHAEADVFLDQIIASPEDHTLRLVYGDWLEDRDQPDPAAMWRSQVHFPFEWKGSLRLFLDMAPFLALFPMVEWVDLIDRMPESFRFNQFRWKAFESDSPGFHHPAVLPYEFHHRTLREPCRPEITYDWQPNPVYLRDAVFDSFERAHAALSYACVEYLMGFWPVCQECLKHNAANLASGATHVFRFMNEPRRLLCKVHLSIEASFFDASRYTIIPLPRKS